MQYKTYSGAIRLALKAALGADAWMRAQVVRKEDPFSSGEGTAIGEIHGYRYKKRDRDLALQLGIPGEISGNQSNQWFMDLSEGFPVCVLTGDQLIFGDGSRMRVIIVAGSGGFAGFDIYRLYKLEVC